jgi:phenylpyruvate tautomerase PptA (4-oxalocrotonate tautomerase family)
LREEFIKELVKNNLFDEANIELNKIIKNKIEHKSRITDSLNILIKSNWYIEETNLNNKNFYNKNTELIEDYLYSDIEDTLVYVDYVNKDKYIINFKDKNKNK